MPRKKTFGAIRTFLFLSGILNGGFSKRTKSTVFDFVFSFQVSRTNLTLARNTLMGKIAMLMVALSWQKVR